MPTYTFRRPDGEQTTRKLSFEEYDLVSQGNLLVTDDAGTVLELVFNPQGTNFVLKDGPSGGWASKALKENKYREGHRQVMARREKDHVFKTRLIPNYQGAEAPTWKDAQEEARSKQGHAAAITYEPLVAQEKRAQ